MVIVGAGTVFSRATIQPVSGTITVLILVLASIYILGHALSPGEGQGAGRGSGVSFFSSRAFLSGLVCSLLGSCGTPVHLSRDGTPVGQ